MAAKQVWVRAMQWMVVTCYAGAAVAARSPCGNIRGPVRVAAGEAVTGGIMLAVCAGLAFALALTTAAPVHADATDDLLAAAKGGTASEVSAALAAGADLNARGEHGNTPLHWAARQNPEPSVVAVLIEAGANLNARDEGGWTPLHAGAAHNSEPSVVEALIEAGANLNARDEGGWTPLHAGAAHNSEPSVVEALIEAGADIDVRDEEGGWTPLHAGAAHNSEPSVIEALIEAGADPSARDKDGKTPFDYAKKHNEALRGTDVYWRLNEGRFK